MPIPPSSDLAVSMTLVDRILGSDVDYVEAAVPLFFVLAAVEFLIGFFGRLELHRLNDSLTDLSCGIIDQTLKLFLHGIFLALYIVLFDNFALFDIAHWPPAGKYLAALLCFLGVDLCFYWHHRFAHMYSAPWATHVVHHQSQEFNLIVALRQSAFEHYMMSFFYLPLALLGFPPAWYVAMFAFNLIWQFWCHTRLIKSLGPLEWIFNTPSHHRVHHGRNLKYLDKNFAGTLIIWDRLFGTFVAEEEEPVYGITRPFESWNPIWANFHYWVDLYDEAKRAPYGWDKIRIWFMPLGWTPRGLTPKPPAVDVTPQTVIKYDARPPLGLLLYVLFHFGLTLLLGLLVTEAGQKHPLIDLLAPSAFILFSTGTLAGVMERRVWAPWLEGLRGLFLMASAIFPPAPWNLGPWHLPACCLLLFVSAAWLWVYRNEFRRSTTPATSPATAY